MQRRKEKRGLAGLFATLLGETPATQVTDVDPLHLAVSVILTEAASADDDFSLEDRHHVTEVLQRHFHLPEEKLNLLLERARLERLQNPDIWRYTHQINRRCTKSQKLELMEEVWRIILDDGVLERHEDHLAHKLGRLLNLDHPELIQSKLNAKDSMSL